MAVTTFLETLLCAFLPQNLDDVIVLLSAILSCKERLTRSHIIVVEGSSIHVQLLLSGLCFIPNLAKISRYCCRGLVHTPSEVATSL